jgi:hypothetical protein
VIIYFIISICDTYCGAVEMMNVNKDRTGSVVWIMVTCTETVVNAAGVTVPLYVCSCTTVQVRRHTVVLFYLTYTELNRTERHAGNRECPIMRRTVKIWKGK